MNDNEALAAVATALADIAPEVSLDLVDADARLRDEVDLDSLDFLNLVEALHNSTGVDIPEVDYPRVETIRGLTGYLVEASMRVPQR